MVVWPWRGPFLGWTSQSPDLVGSSLTVWLPILRTPSNLVLRRLVSCERVKYDKSVFVSTRDKILLSNGPLQIILSITIHTEGTCAYLSKTWSFYDQNNDNTRRTIHDYNGPLAFMPNEPKSKVTLNWTCKAPVNVTWAIILCNKLTRFKWSLAYVCFDASVIHNKYYAYVSTSCCVVKCSRFYCYFNLEMITKYLVELYNLFSALMLPAQRSKRECSVNKI